MICKVVEKRIKSLLARDTNRSDHPSVESSTFDFISAEATRYQLLQASFPAFGHAAGHSSHCAEGPSSGELTQYVCISICM